MNLLILGGTVFLGRHLAEAALARGHRLTLFNRGRHNPELFPEAEKLRGERDGDLSALEAGRWDAVIDTCGYFPRVVRRSAELLAERTDRYVFISSISVYADWLRTGMDESAPLGTVADETVEEITGETYGPLKALCEAAVEAALPGRALNVRPGLIVGPEDPSGRFTYWPVRIAWGGEVLAPGTPEAPVQIIDVRDLSEWLVRLLESGKTGAYNATGPQYPLTMGGMLETCRAVSGSDARVTWVPDAFLLEQGVEPFSGLPLWIPSGPEHAGFHTVSSRKAIRDGLTFRPLEETVRDTLAWAQGLPPDSPLRAGLTLEREAQLLGAWRRSMS